MSGLEQFEKAFQATQAYSNLWLGKATPKDSIFERLDEKQYVIDEVESACIMWQFCADDTKKSSAEIEGLIDERDAVTVKAEALKNKLQDLYGVNFGEHSSANCPLQGAIEYDDSSLIVYMKERDAFYQNWKDSRNSITVNIKQEAVELTGAQKDEYLSSLKEQLKKCLMEQGQGVITSNPSAPALLKNNCLIGNVTFLKGMPVDSLIQYAEKAFKTEVIAQNSKIEFGTDDGQTWWAHDVPFFGTVQMDHVVKDDEWDIHFNDCWQGPFRSKARCIQHLEECIAERREEENN